MSKFFVDRPIVAIVIAILTVMLGVVSMAKLPVTQLPDIVPPQVNVSTTYTGADALAIEQSVATPIEQQMNGVDNMLYMMSTNANDGTMNLRVIFDLGTDVDIDQVNTQNRVTQASPNLPTSVNDYGITVKKLMGLPVLILSVYSPNGTYNGQFLGNYATININDALLRVPGVGQVTNFGAADYSMRVWVKPDQLAKLGLTVSDLINAVQRQSTVNPAGQIGAEPAPTGQQFTYSVRAPGRLANAEEFGDVIVRQNPDGSKVSLKDVSRIELGSVVYQQIGRYNGKPAVIIAVRQSPGSNALAVAKQVKREMEELKSRFPQDLDYAVSMDTTLPITEGMKEILTTLLEATVLVIIVVFLFLQGWRATLIPLIAVPVSLIGTFAVFPLLGFSINTLSLFGLILAIGLVVDDAIVVVEAVELNIEHGQSPREATIKAMEEVSAPVIGIALILSSVFIPMAFMGGIKGLLNRQFAVTIAISVLISAFNALTLSPALSALLLRPHKKSHGPVGKFFAWFNRWFLKMTGGYVNWSHALIRRWGIALVLLLGVSIAAVTMGKRLPTSFMPEEDQGYAFLQIQLPDAASLQRTDAVMHKVDEILAHTHGIQGYDTIAGFSLLSNTSASYMGSYFLQFEPWVSAFRPKRCLLALNRKLRDIVASKLILDWSPEQISGWLRSQYPDDESMRVSHETIYRSLFIQTRGILKKELLDYLRSKRHMRRSRHANVHGHGRIIDALSIRERPAETEDRAIPGHWEGDLLSGGKNSHMVTLVERHSRFLMLIKVPSKDTAVVVAALSKHVGKLPATLRRSLTWDRGLEMAKHKEFTVATAVQVYFCDPRSPWQRGTNENTNLLLRQYFPRGTDLSVHSQAHLDQIALRLNQRPRKTLGFETPASKLQTSVASTV